MNINLSKHVIEFCLHSLIVALLIINDDCLGVKVYLYFLILSCILVNFLSAEVLPGALNVYGKVRIFILTLSDIITFIISICIVYSTSLIGKIIDKSAQADSSQYQNVPPIISLDEFTEKALSYNEAVSSAAKNIESAPFGLEVVTFGIAFYFCSRALWCIYQLLKQFCITKPSN